MDTSPTPKVCGAGRGPSSDSAPLPNLPQAPHHTIWGLPRGLRDRFPPSQILQILALTLFLILGSVLILIFPPIVFSHVEGWSFSEGFYFAFITLSTIGFGDYVVGENEAVA